MAGKNHLIAALSRAHASGEQVFLRFPDGREPVSYGEFFDRAGRFAAALAGAGVEPGDRVAVQAQKSVEMLELYIGTVMAGAVFLPLNPAYTDSELGYFLTDAEPRVFVCDPGRRDDLAPVARDAGVSELWTLGADGEGSAARALQNHPKPLPPVARGPEDLAAILYTSGTTGRSKGAMLSHRALGSNAEALVAAWRFSAADVLIHALPIFHTHGLFVATNTLLMAGGSMIWFPRFDAAQIVSAMPAATSMMGVPTFYTRLLAQPGLAEAAAAMRLFVSGSAPLLAETHRQWREVTGHAILERYGMTETNMNTSNPYDGERRAGTVGFPLPGVELRIVDEAGKPVAGGIGTIEVRGPNLFSGYWRMPEKTAEDMRPGGWFNTGDLGSMDADGYVQIVGRGKDLIISGGLNVYPKEVETAIDEVPGVTESAVIGVPHPDFGEAVVAVVVGKDGADLDADGIADAIAGRLARFKQPKRIVFVDELPRNTMGKVQKNALRARYADLFA